LSRASFLRHQEPPYQFAAQPRSQKRLAIVITHPIQYFSHVYRELAKLPDIELRVFFASMIGLERYHDSGFGVELSWQCDLLNGFDHEFLPGADRVTRLDWRSLLKVEVSGPLSRFEPDAVLLNGYSHPVVLRAWRWAVRNRRKVLLFGDGNGRTTRDGGRARQRMKRACLTPLLQSVDSVLTLGEANELYWSQLGVEPSRTCWAPLYQPSPELVTALGSRRDAVRADIRERLDVSPKQVIVLYSGKFLARKRVIDLVRAVDASEKLVGVYVGDGPCRAECETAAKSKRHRFVGFANLPELARCYASADILCHPAELEPYGLVIAEAAANGLPILASSTVGALGLRSHGQVGRNAEVFTARDVEHLSSELDRIAADRDLRERMAQESRAVATELAVAYIAGIKRAVGVGQ
jgi:glycosyltransferase involved in cell wall biosynthesis